MKRLIVGVLIVSMLIVILTGCVGTVDNNDAVDTETVVVETAGSETQDNIVNWGESTHSNDVDPDYDTVFNQSEVLEFNITIDSQDWEAMQADLEENVTGGRGQAGGQKGVMPERDRQALPEGEIPQNARSEGDRPALPEGEIPQNARPEIAGQPAPGQPAVNNQIETTSESEYDPIWVESSITFDDTTWDHVGIRFKGNSSLTSAVSSGNGKLSFKLDFDEFEDEYPEINNQRFYGFKQLNLNNNYSDESLMREKVSADLFRDFGVPAANTTFVVVNVDYGEGSQFYGVYTLVEEMDDTGIESQFGDDSGNLYKPEGTAASFADGTYDDDEMVKKNNEDEADYSDVIALYDVINSENRESDVESWKSELEEVFNVDGFLKWLAANTVMQNWDTYGNMTHNYFLYNNPETNKLEWIPWDSNEALQEGKGNRGALSLGLDEVNDNWPLIDYLIGDTEYKAIYDSYLEQFTQEIFTEEKMTKTYTEYYEMIKEYAYAEEEGYSFIKSDQSFDSAVEALKAHVVERNEAVKAYLEN
ncbi:MAG: CotH kinase family protein [Gudongella sp.]|nr:CotH kinase family protein [Gudongella sp.]